jgi:hypothetical protein
MSYIGFQFRKSNIHYVSVENSSYLFYEVNVKTKAAVAAPSKGASTGIQL